MNAAPLLEVSDLRLQLHTEVGPATVLDGVGFTLAANETLGLVGESGCGKTMTALALLGLLPPAAHITSGEIRYHGRDLLRAESAARHRLRGREIAMAFQEPQAALDPVQRCGDALGETLREVAGLDAAAARSEALRLLHSVALPDAERVAARYPHELSGGMCQRIAVALAVACRPRLLLADEVTRGLDPTIQEQILDLLGRLQVETGLGILLIGHDLAVIAARAGRVAVMLGGRIVEVGPVGRVFRTPGHPYTRALLAARPRLDGPRRRLGTIQAGPLAARGCPFHLRCPERIERCARDDPPARPLGPDHTSRCFVDPPAQPGGLPDP